MDAKTLEFQEVEAEVVEHELAISEAEFAIDPLLIKQDIEELCRAINKALRSADELAIDDGELAKLDLALAKNFATSLNRDIKGVSDRRKKLKADCTQPVADMEAKLKAVMAPVDQLQLRYRNRQAEAETQEKQAKMAALKAYYEELAPFIAMPLDRCDRPLVPFERIANPKWGNKTMSAKKCEQEIDELVEDIAAKQKAVEGMQFAHPEDARAAFWATLSIEAAVTRDQELTAQDERRAALEKAQQQAVEKAQSFDRTEVTQQEAADHCKPAEPEQESQYVFTARMTPTQKTQLIRFMRQLGIHGTFRKEQ